MKIKNNLNKNIFFGLIGFIFGIIVMIVIFYTNFFGFNSANVNKSPFFTESSLDNDKYNFLRPFIASGYKDNNEKESLKWFPSERNLKNLVQDAVFENNEVKTSVFFLNLNNSGWFSVNPTDTFIPASLLKLPMLISYYKLHESEKDLFDKKINYQGENFNQFKNLGNGTIVPGQTYTVKELMREMVVHSDNNALQLLYKYREESLKSIFADMNIPLPSTDQEIASKDFMTARDIGRFLLVLYNSSYLSLENSEEALQILSESVFKDGIVAGVPSNIVVSHKFGERTLDQNGQNLKTELHDCGIVYHPNIPYIVCVMTKGSDIESEKLQIQKISKIIYEGVDSFANNSKEN
ncbi:MAG: serine hydrolase [Candidatus Paceibacterota bacterium]